MMSRAKQKALKAHPVCTFDDILEERRAERRYCHQQGYEEGLKDTLDRACDYLLNFLPMEQNEKMAFVEEFRKDIEG